MIWIYYIQKGAVFICQNYITPESISAFESYLYEKEKSAATIEKYLRDVKVFFDFAKNREVSRELTLEYKQFLCSNGYAVRSINSMLASLNSFFEFIGKNDCRVKTVKLQKEVYCPAEKELTKAEYECLVNTAKAQGKEELCLILQTICGTGIRVSEPNFKFQKNLRKGLFVFCRKNKNGKNLFLKSVT